MLSQVFVTLSLVFIIGSHKVLSDTYSRDDTIICDESSPLLQTSNPLTSMDVAYEDARQQFAYQRGTEEERNENIIPTIIVTPQTESDIQDIIRFARECDYAVAIRSGGHQYSGLSSCNVDLGNCLQVSMVNFKKYEIHRNDKYDPTYITSITAGVGLRLEEITAKNTLNNIFIPAGVCGQVGLGGHYQSSGMGISGRSVGLGLDHVESFRIILSDGSIKEVSYKGRDKSLYWAVLGGNPGSWGIITEYTIRALHDSNFPHSYGIAFIYTYTPDTISQLAKTLLSLAEEPFFMENRDFGAFLGIIPLDDLSGHLIILTGVWTGIDNGDIFDTSHNGYKLFVESFKALNPLPYPVSFEGPITLSQAHSGFSFDVPIPPFKYYSHSGWTDKALNNSWVDLMCDELNAIVEHDELFMVWQLSISGGQMAQENKRNSFPWRNVKTGVDTWVLFLDDSSAELAKDMIYELRDSTKGYWANGGNNGGMKLWFATDGDEVSIDEVWQLYYPNEKHYRRLQNIKKKYDPINLFRNSLTIPLPNSRKYNRY